MAKISAVKIPIEQLVKEYASMKEQESVLKKRKEYLATTIKDYAEKNGVKNDTGSYFIEVDDFICGKVARKSVSFTPDAISKLKEWGHPECISTTEYVNEDAVELLIATGKLTASDVEPLTQTKVTFAIDVKSKSEVEDMPEVQQGKVALPSAAQKIPKK